MPEGRPNKLANFANLTQSARADISGVSHYTQRKLDKIAVERPDLKAEIKHGRMSVDAAYRITANKPNNETILNSVYGSAKSKSGHASVSVNSAVSWRR